MLSIDYFYQYFNTLTSLPEFNQNDYDKCIEYLKKHPEILKNLFPGRKVIFDGRYTRTIECSNPDDPDCLKKTKTDKNGKEITIRLYKEVSIQRIAVIDESTNTMTTHALIPIMLVPYLTLPLSVQIRLIRDFLRCDKEGISIELIDNDVVSDFQIFNDRLHRIHASFKRNWKEVFEEDDLLDSLNDYQIATFFIKTYHMQLMQPLFHAFSAYIVLNNIGFHEYHAISFYNMPVDKETRKDDDQYV